MSVVRSFSTGLCENELDHALLKWRIDRSEQKWQLDIGAVTLTQESIKATAFPARMHPRRVSLTMGASFRAWNTEGALEIMVQPGMIMH